MNVIETEGITYYYEGTKTPSLDGVSIRIDKGVKTVILGANGAGKSTLFYHFNGVVKPASGTVKVMGSPVSYRKKGLRELRSKVAVVLQNPDDQIFGQTVEGDVAYGPRNMKLPDEEVSARVEEALFQTGLGDLREKNTMQLSYGQRKRLALAGALAMKPEVLIMDEPTAGLDPQMALELMELAEQLHSKGTTIVISTHDVDLAYAWADEIHVLRKGKLIYSGTSEGFYCDPIAVHSTGVMQPSMFVMNENLAGIRGTDPAPYPRTESQLVSKMASGPKGSLRIVPVDADFPDVSASEDVKTGVFGTVSRRLASDSGKHVDFMFNGFESCVGECLTGKDSLLFCDRDCLGLVESKLERLKDFGSDIGHDVKGRRREGRRAFRRGPSPDGHSYLRRRSTPPGTMAGRTAKVERSTRETRITAEIDLDGTGRFEVESSIQFLKHMVETLARYASFDLKVSAYGDNDHHIIEDTAITVGKAFSQALDGCPIERMATAVVPMDDALVMTSLDLVDRPYADIECPSPDYHHFMRSFAMSAGITLHVAVLRGFDEHHIIEAGFKSMGKALKEAVKVRETELSTKDSVKIGGSQRCWRRG